MSWSAVALFRAALSIRSSVLPTRMPWAFDGGSPAATKRFWSSFWPTLRFFWGHFFCAVIFERTPYPEGPNLKDQKKSRFRARLQISSENEIFEWATHRGPTFCGGNRDVEIEVAEQNWKVKRDWKFRARFFFWSLGPLGIPGFETRIFSPFSKSKVHIFRHFRPDTAKNPRIPCFCMYSMIQKSKLLCPELPWQSSRAIFNLKGLF